MRRITTIDVLLFFYDVISTLAVDGNILNKKAFAETYPRGVELVGTYQQI